MQQGLTGLRLHGTSSADTTASCPLTARSTEVSSAASPSGTVSRSCRSANTSGCRVTAGLDEQAQPDLELVGDRVGAGPGCTDPTALIDQGAGRRSPG